MNNINRPSHDELPSKGKLVKSTILAVAIAAIILITVVLPAEYGLDPTGVGEVIGLTQMGRMKVALAEEAAIESEAAAADKMNDAEVLVSGTTSDIVTAVTATTPREDTFTINLAPSEGKEIKLTMARGTTVNYAWYTDGGEANFDAHADSKSLDIKYHNYEKGRLERSEGTMEAAFDGNHGWYWRNRTTEPMNVTLEVTGMYTAVVQY